MEGSLLIAVVIIGLATYRLTRFFLFDSLLSSPRDAFHSWLLSHPNFLPNFLYDLTTCAWCLSVWVSAALVAFWASAWPWDWSEDLWLAFGAVAALGGLLRAYEPEG